MIKKIFSLLFVLLLLCGCNTTNVNYTYDIKSIDVDMSEYEGVSSTEHMFKAITSEEFFNCVDNKSSGVFYLGRTNCACCQTCIKYLNNAAMQLNVPIYYMDVYDERMPITDIDLMDKLKIYLFDVMNVVDGEKQLQTPTVFSVINGEIVDSIICLGNYTWEDEPSYFDELILVNRYKSLLKPFAK